MKMPKMGESITEGTVVKWLKKAGDAIEKDDTILEISTDKVDSEIPTPVDGVIKEILVEEGETVEVGSPIALIETEQAGAESESPEGGVQEEREPEKGESGGGNGQTEAPPETVRQEQQKKKTEKGSRFYSPVVMNIAAENNIGTEELEQIPGTGLNNRLTKKDLLAYLDRRETKTAPAKEPAAAAEAAKPQPEATATGGENVEILPMDHIRQKIAAHMIHSKQTSAHVGLYTEVDMQNIFRIREQQKADFKKREGFSLTYLPFIVEATVKALKEFPMLNAQIDEDRIILKKFYNIGIAVAVNDRLIVPNVFHADEKNRLGLARSINSIATRARNKQLDPNELSNGTFSISNFGVFGTTVGFPIINQPQVAILGVGAVKKRPVVINDAIAIRPVMYLSLTIDHRLIDGAMGSQFLERVKTLLEQYENNEIL